MPTYENNNLKGTLFITFDVEFPKGELTDSEKEGRSVGGGGLILFMRIILALLIYPWPHL